MHNQTEVQNENPFISILFNIILPVVILEQLTKRLNPTMALLVALAFPIGYGAVDYFKRRHKNYLSLLGIVNVLFTGGLALMNLEGFWFAVKEAGFPLILGAGVFFSTFTSRPVMKMLACNPNVLNMELIESRLNQQNKAREFERHLILSTYFLTLSFVLSSFLNFILARSIFVDIDPAVAELERNSILNDQIAQMTWLSFVVIVLPLMIFMMGILWHLIRGIQRLTGLELEQIFKGTTTSRGQA